MPGPRRVSACPLSTTYAGVNDVAGSIEFLLGDAAHLTPPFIGQGMGTGLRDAMNLAWKLAGVRNGSLAPSVLDTYEHERKPHARHMIGMALTIGWSMTAGGEVGNLVRRFVVPRLRLVPGLREKIIDSRTPALRRSTLVAKGRGPRHLAGTLCPNPVVASRERLDTILGNGFALVTAVRKAGLVLAPSSVLVIPVDPAQGPNLSSGVPADPLDPGQFACPIAGAPIIQQFGPTSFAIEPPFG